VKTCFFGRDRDALSYFSRYVVNEFHFDDDDLVYVAFMCKYGECEGFLNAADDRVPYEFGVICSGASMFGDQLLKIVFIVASVKFKFTTSRSWMESKDIPLSSKSNHMRYCKRLSPSIILTEEKTQPSGVGSH
jgi:hypothetical protein